MTLNDYQEKAMSTCMDSCDNFAYSLSGLTAEVGEVNDKVAKAVRREQCVFVKNQLGFTNEESYKNIRPALAMELSDCLWFVAHMAKQLGYSLEDIAQMNLNKLQARKQNGTIDGSGDGVTAQERGK